MLKTNEISIIILSSDKRIDWVNQFFLKIKDYGIKLICITSSKIRLHNYLFKSLYFEFSDNFSDLRNFGLSKADSEWVFFLDSDEKVSDELLAEIPHLIKNKDIDGYWIPRKTFISPMRYLQHGLFYPDYQMRLFRNKKEYRFVGAVHEQLTIPHEKTAHAKSPLLHYPNNPKYTAFYDIKNLYPYMFIQSKEMFLKLSENNHKSILIKILLSIQYLIIGIYKGLTLFLGGYFRGKGFLDGWAGFRAHVLFSISIGAPYIISAYTYVQSQLHKQ